MTQPNTTRRDLLRFGTSAAAYAAGAAIVVGGAALASEAKGATPGVNPRLLRAIALRDRAEKAVNRFDDDVEMPARRAYAAAAKALPAVPAVPHRSVATTFINTEGEEKRLSTDMIGAAACARRVANDPTWSDMGDEVWRRANCELAALADERDALVATHQANHDAAVQRLQATHRLDALSERSEALSTREFKLWLAAIAVPATGLPDVLTKLDFVERTRGGSMSEDVLEAIHADVRRLAGGEA
jgi:hypothetical protein